MTDPHAQMPPQSREAERSVLGSMLRDNDTIDDVLQILREKDFYLDAHQKIFAGISALYDRGHPIDTAILAEHLNQQKRIEDVGGHVYLNELWDAGGTGANAEYYARIVRDKALLRALIHVGNETVRGARDHVMPADELVADAERKVYALAEQGMVGQVESNAEGLRRACDRIDQWQMRDRALLPDLATGFVDLDDKVRDLEDSDLVIIAARTSQGKTAFALNVARHILVDLERPLFFVSLEQSKIDLNLRLLSCQAGVDRVRMRSVLLSQEEIERLAAARRVLQQAEARLFIDETKEQNVWRIAANARRLKRRHGIAAVFIDYLSLIAADNRRDPLHERVAAITRRLKILGGELSLPIVALAQLNREPESRPDHKPRLSDLRDSGAIEQDADIVMLLHQEGGDEASGVALVIVNIAKQRNGPTGEVTLVFQKRFMRFENYSPEFPYGSKR